MLLPLYWPLWLTDGIASPVRQLLLSESSQTPTSLIFSDGGLSDHDEIRGRERDVAILSPPKGKMCLNSEVSIYLALIIYLSNLSYNRLSWSKLNQ